MKPKTHPQVTDKEHGLLSSADLENISAGDQATTKALVRIAQADFEYTTTQPR